MLLLKGSVRAVGCSECEGAGGTAAENSRTFTATASEDEEIS